MARIHTNKKHRKNRVPADFKKWLADKWQKQPADMTLLKLNGRLGNRAVPEYALQVVSNNDAKMNSES